MDPTSLTAAPESLLETRPSAPKPIRDYSHLDRAEEALVLRLHDAGKTQTDIAQIVGCSQPTVSRVLHEFLDTRELAKRKLHNSATALVERVIAKADVDQSLEVLDRIGVAEKRESGGKGVQVNILSAGQLFGLPGPG